ncbi:hypothetical protein FRB99_005968 [Tulasnella sp. 403]|nr:hypothetical protein FRB99_005968 [Tulasnella sp. 403]
MSPVYKKRRINGLQLTLVLSGNALDVYFVFRNDVNAWTNVTFFIDNVNYGTLLQVGQGKGWIYNYRAFTISGLEDKPHKIVISQSSPSGMILDYLVYNTTGNTLSNPAPSTSINGFRSTPTNGASRTPASTSPSLSTTQIPSTPESATGASVVGPNRSGELIGAVLGAIFGTLALVIALGVGVVFYRRIQRRRRLTMCTFYVTV